MLHVERRRQIPGLLENAGVRHDQRILTCFLEYDPSRVMVHDLLHEWDGAAWRLRVSVYEKLRIASDRIMELLEQNGLAVERRAGASGMICLVAHRH